MLFKDLNLVAPILTALEKEGYKEPTQIQGEAIPHILEGKDVFGIAQTGTGKTAAFAIPTLQILSQEKKLSNTSNEIKCLVLTPTRELALQVGESFTKYGRNLGLSNTTIFGGVPQYHQVRKLKKGVDILIATPGRLFDLMDQGYISLKHIEMLVLDEADRMLDMGFSKDVEKILEIIPEKKQTLFFSATIPKEIVSLADSILNDPVKVEVAPVSSASESVEQFIYHVTKDDKRLLLPHILKEKKIRQALVFSRTKHGADKIAMDLRKMGIRSDSIHGDKKQGFRQRALRDFKSGRTKILVATDIAARGIDINSLEYVFNYDLPEESETYVHRIGRTGRGGATGTAFSFCSQEEYSLQVSIQKLIGKEIELIEEQPHHLEIDTKAFKKNSRRRYRGGGGRGGPRGRHGGNRRRSSGGSGSQGGFGRGSNDRRRGGGASSNGQRRNSRPRNNNK